MRRTMKYVVKEDANSRQNYPNMIQIGKDSQNNPNPNYNLISKHERMLAEEQLVFELSIPEHMEGALLKLSQLKRDQYPDFALTLWHSCGTITVLLKEILDIYNMLTPPKLTTGASNRVCNALALLQRIASHPVTRDHFLKANIHLYLYPFLTNVNKSQPFEFLRLASLGVIGALLKVHDADAINFLLSTEIIPSCLRVMEVGSELSKTVATYIVRKILLDDMGVNYICAAADRILAVTTVLGNMVSSLAVANESSVRLLKYIICCYLRLSENPWACQALERLPKILVNPAFSTCLQEEPSIRQWMTQLNINVFGNRGAPPHYI